MSFQNSNPDSWQAVWIQANQSPGQWNKSLWDALDELKFGYLCSLIPNEGLALEVGCGTARVLAMLAGVGWRVMGVDFAPSALQLARMRFSEGPYEIDLISGNAYHLPFDNDSFDFVGSTGLLEHFEQPQPMIAEMIRVLRAGGVLYADVVPSKFSLLRSLDGMRLSPAAEKQMFERPFTKGEIQTMFADTGALEKLSVFPAGILPPRKLFSRRFPIIRQLEYPVSKVIGRLSSHFDGSWVADLLGFYYFVSATKVRR